MHGRYGHKRRMGQEASRRAGSRCAGKPLPRMVPHKAEAAAAYSWGSCLGMGMAGRRM